ncbi:hypothetical protein BCAH1134_C0152 (plasmid) [Bacillus cereus AH1134]|nr:hypothetical protein BCAH1134_C0152 [Bacillus cereus AH1134]
MNSFLYFHTRFSTLLLTILFFKPFNIFKLSIFFFIEKPIIYFF